MTPSEIYIGSTLAYCTSCGGPEQARIVARKDGVFMERLCPRGVRSVKIAADYRWYMERAVRPQKVSRPLRPVPSREGCPHDCGLCEWHAAAVQLPVFSITNDCNLNCPICFTYNRPDRKYYKTREDAERILDRIRENAGDVQLINMTGGEPTLHPQLFDLIDAAKKKGVRRITMNTNGLRVAREPDFAERLRDAGVHLVFSLDTFDPQKSVTIHGADITAEKRQALEVMERLDIPATILSVCVKGVNEEDVSEIIGSYIKKDFVRSVTVQNMTFTGYNGGRFEPRDHITIDEVEALAARNDGIAREDFFSLGSYHPLCYSVAYYINSEGRSLSLKRLLDDEALERLSADCYLLDPERDMARDLVNGINRLWAEGEDEEYIARMKKTLNRVYPADRTLSREERNFLLERMVKMIYIHPHMDEDNFDLDRVCRCGDCVPDESGALVPACSYNLLYRQRDERYWKE